VQAYKLDSKSDDGMPYLGKMYGGNASSGAIGTCITGAGTSSTYTRSNESPACEVSFPIF
ncbi:hypothetical protein N9W34_05835, partial [Rickettsiales bacterium]|nr:hypothetical protein [Rickettsiales bacterium]